MARKSAEPEVMSRLGGELSEGDVVTLCELVKVREAEQVLGEMFEPTAPRTPIAAKSKKSRTKRSCLDPPSPSGDAAV